MKSENARSSAIHRFVGSPERTSGLLDQLELADHTIVVYFSDNGPNSHRFHGGMKGRKGGSGALTLRALEIPGRYVMDVRRVTLTLQHEL